MRSLVFAFAALLLAITQAHARCSPGEIGCVMGPNGWQPGPTYQGPSQPIYRPQPPQQQQIIQPQPTPTLCPDGSYVFGQCYLAPNGRYIGR